MKGVLYGVSVGPGNPELLTLKAVRILQSCPVVASPVTNGENTLALDIAKGAVDLSQKEVLKLPFLMKRDKAAMEQNHRENGQKIAAYLEKGMDVAMVNLGDVAVYSTFAYLMEYLQAQGYTVRMIPGVTSFCAVAAALGTGLTTMNKPIHIIPAGGMDTQSALELEGTRVLMKNCKALPQVKAALAAKGLTQKAMLVQNCGLPNEQIYRNIEQAPDDSSYFTTIIVKE